MQDTLAAVNMHLDVELKVNTGLLRRLAHTSAHTRATAALTKHTRTRCLL